MLSRGKTLRLVVIGPLPPWRGGVAHHTSHLVASLRERHELRVFSFRRMYPAWLYPGTSSTLDVDVRRLAQVDYLISGNNPLSWMRVLARIVSWRPDGVVLPWWSVFWAPFAAFLVRSLRRFGIPTYFLCHNVLDHDAGRLHKHLASFALVAGEGYLCHTSADAKRLRQLLPESSVVVHAHPRYLHFPAPADVPPRRAKLELLFFGYVRPYKGVDILIEALGLLGELDFHLCIAGDWWVDRAPIEKRISALGLQDRVSFLARYIEDAEAAVLITRADAMVLPYREASGSGVAALALHFERPAVASRVGGLGEYIIDGETGYLVEPEDARDLARGIARLQQPLDWSLRIARHKDQATWLGLAEAVADMVHECL
jgi:glycosyltransferase involved in cell wall biosynthesis